jgi:NADH-quinone oxidoreductase subunit H
MLQTLYMFFKPHLFPLLYALVIVAVLPLLAGYVVLLERKVMADMQARLGPMRVGPHGLLQPIADAVKLLMKEDIIPESADKWIFWLAPLLSVTAGMVAMAALPFGPVFQIANLNVGLLFILGIGSMGIFGIVLGGWASNSHYSLLGALRSAAQLVSYETAAGHGGSKRSNSGRHAQHRRTSKRPIRTARLVHFRSANRILPLLGGQHRGDKSRAFRFARS